MKVIHGLIEELLQEKNFCYNKFNEKVVKVAYSLICDATIKIRFNAEKDFFLFVTNRNLDNFLHYRFKNEIGFINTSADSNHTYIKFLMQIYSKILLDLTKLLSGMNSKTNLNENLLSCYMLLKVK